MKRIISRRTCNDPTIFADECDYTRVVGIYGRLTFTVLQGMGMCLYAKYRDGSISTGYESLEDLVMALYNDHTFFYLPMP